MPIRPADIIQRQAAACSQMDHKTIMAVWDAYSVWYHHSNIWKHLHYRGVRTLKLPLDLWNYQEIIHERGIDWVVETGTRHGGSALFFADCLTGRNAAGLVISVDVDASANQVGSHPHIRFLLGDSASPEIVGRVCELLPADRGPLFLILDSDHSFRHVIRELEAYVPLLRPGDYLVVEDTNVNGHPVRPDFGPGPWEAIHAFLDQHPATLIPDKVRERKFGVTAAPDGYYIKA